MKDLDVEAVGVAAYRHCTSPKALYVTMIDRWWLLATGCVVGAIVGCIVIVTSEKQFAAKGCLLVYQKLPTFLDESTRIPDAKAYDSLFATHVQLIGSPLIVEKAVEDFQLDQLPELDEEHAFHRELGNKSVGEMIRDSLSVGRAGSGDSAGAFVLSVNFKHKSAQECPKVVEAILKTYKAYINDSMLDDQNKAVELLTTLKSQMEDDIERKEQAYRSYLKEAPGVWDQQSKRNSHQDLVDAFSKELTQLEIDRKTVRSILEIFSMDKDPSSGRELTDIDRLALVDEIHLPRIEVLVSLAGDNNVSRLQELYPKMQEVANVQYDDLVEKMVELKTISKNVGEKHPKYQDMKSEIEVLKSQVFESGKNAQADDKSNPLNPSDLVNAYEVLLTTELQKLDKQIDFTTKRREEELAASIKLQDFSIRADRLKEEFERSQEMSNVLLDKMQKQSVLSQFGSYVVEIIEQPGKGQLVWPKKPIILALFTITGFFMATFAALLVDLIETTQLEKHFRFLPNWLIRNQKPSPAVS